MAELLFIATTVFVAYVVYTAINGGKDQPEDASQPSATPESTPEPAATTPDAPPPPEPEAAKPETSKTAVSKPEVAKPEAAKPVATKPSGKPAETKPKAAKAAAAKKTKPESVAGDSVKNPKTGEIAKLPPNYSFAKRWIKEALVEEGLVDKIYKNSELNDDTNAKIQTALNALKAMKKYQ